jgi:hypothetical protein
MQSYILNIIVTQSAQKSWPNICPVKLTIMAGRKKNVVPAVIYGQHLSDGAVMVQTFRTHWVRYGTGYQPVAIIFMALPVTIRNLVGIHCVDWEY